MSTAKTPNTRFESSKKLNVVLDVLFLLLQIVIAIAESLYRLLKPKHESSVKDEVVLITGTAHGIGKELALQYASQGATVVGWDINGKGNDITMEEICRLGFPKAYGYVCDVSNRNNVMHVAKKVLDEVGDVSILINNAGILITKHFSHYSQEDVEKIFNINVLANFWTIQAFLPTMLKNNHGHIIGVSSIAGLLGSKNIVPYSASKFAVRGIMESLYEELRSDPQCKVRCTVVMPFFVDTDLCEKPKVRFEKLMPLLTAKDTAKEIISAQRKEELEISIPKYTNKLIQICRIIPMKVAILLKDFFDCHVDV